MGALARFLRGFGYAFAGLGRFLRRDRNAKVHLAACAVAVAAGAAGRIERWEWCAVALACGLVFAAEALNSALECALDALHPERHPGIGAAKDMAAGAVLLAAAAALAVGIAVFGGRAWALVGGR
jgi:diacylglycerol kinase